MITNSGQKRERNELEDRGVFADPTYDITFKMLFGSEQNKELLLSFINSLLSFEGGREVLEVEINSNELAQTNIGEIKGSVDILCTSRDNQKIAVEMQRKDKNYYLARTQQYMSKLISGQVKTGENSIYHKAIMDTYLLSIEKENVFYGPYRLENEEIYEITVVPTVVETGQLVPGNKMHWKFFELPKFAKALEGQIPEERNSLKIQWLDFLVSCRKHTEIPENIAEIIKKGYEIMNRANWTPDQEALYWKACADAVSEREERENDIKKARLEAQEEGREEGREKGIKEGREEGKIEAEVAMIKTLINLGIENNNILSSLKNIPQNKASDTILYVNDHLSDSDIQICIDLRLIGEFSSKDSEE